MSHRVISVDLLDNAGNRITEPGKTVLGLDVDKVNIRVTVGGGASTADLPAKLSVTAMTHEPARKRPHKGSMSGPLTAELARQGQDLVYLGSIALGDLAPFLRAGDDQLEVATVVRTGGTSDKLFVAPLRDAGWSLRGAAVQPTDLGSDSTGDMPKERPDARTLFHAGGVEVLEVSVARTEGLDLRGAARARVFLRSPADIFFYSGHGAWWDGQLLIDTGNHNYDDWMDPSEVLRFWSKNPNVQTSPFDLDVLIINGCSVLFWNKDNEPVDDPDRRSYGLGWAKLLVSKEGPLFAILGYRFTAPLDAVRGDTIAAEMGQAAKELRDQWDKYAYKWMQINAKYRNTWTAAAFDSRTGYYYLNLPDKPGYDKKRPDGSIMGPFGIP